MLKMRKIVRGWVFGGFLMSRQGTRVTWNILFETVTYFSVTQLEFYHLLVGLWRVVLMWLFLWNIWWC